MKSTITLSLRRLMIAGLGLVVVLTFGLVLCQKSRNTDDEPNMVTSNNQSTIKQKPKRVEIKLTNTAPIEARTEDYGLDQSLWRIVSKTWPLSDSRYRPGDLQLATVSTRLDKSIDERSVRIEMMADLEKLFTATAKQGYELMIGSGFRSYELQNAYYTNYAKIYGQAQADLFSAKPGQSEHQTGLAVDLAYQNYNCYLASCFGDQPAGKWLELNAHQYGFILRYPKDKASITGFQYEPWHFRYVGPELAKAIYESGLTLDEVKPLLDTALAELKTRELL